MYKDQDKQREANRKAQARFKAKGITEGITIGGITDRVLPDGTTDISVVKVLHKMIKSERTSAGNIRVSKPGDADYVPQCETTRAFIEGRPKRVYEEKRGKDIKTFEDLPEDVQNSINRMSINKDGTFNQTTKANRTAIAIHYQHLFPGRYYNTGVA